ncbi:MAG: hypothetical protein D6726_11985 [Nitrospirae bacterium]|nr:MAG: hypothetical protein D6726_11985 [Nitrospirota bacterium]
MKEIILKHDDIRDPDTITQVTEKAFKDAGLDIHRHEVESLEDDFDRGVRVLQVKAKQFFTVPDIPWHKK